MGRYLEQLRSIQQATSDFVDSLTPTIIAGDVFDKWNSPAELINFALDALPDNTFAIPGQHDLPYHNASLLNKSAYGLLTKTGKVKQLRRREIFGSRDDILVTSYGFDPPWDEVIDEITEEDRDLIRIAIVHKYVWTTERTSYLGANPENRVKGSLLRKLTDKYHWSVFGDNHKGFHVPGILNCGTFIRRKADEIRYQPIVGVLCTKGSEVHMVLVLLDTEEDEFFEPIVKLSEDGNEAMASVVEMLNQLQLDYVDFQELVKRAIRDEGVSEGVARIVEGIIAGR